MIVELGFVRLLMHEFSCHMYLLLVRSHSVKELEER